MWQVTCRAPFSITMQASWRRSLAVHRTWRRQMNGYGSGSSSMPAALALRSRDSVPTGCLCSQPKCECGSPMSFFFQCDLATLPAEFKKRTG
mgnify:CR=1 FL=1